MSPKDKETALATKEDAIDFKVKFAKAELNLIRNHVAVGATPGEFALFIYDAQKRGLNPLKKQIYFVKYGGKPSHQTSIDGYRAIAEATGQYNGMSEVKYGDMYHYKNGNQEVPEYAEVTVFRKGAEHGFPARVYFDEFAQVFSGKLSSQWAQRPRHMLAKCAEALALRKAFPEQLSGIYTTDEFAEDEGSVVHVRENTIEVEEPAPKQEAPKKAFDNTETMINPPKQQIIREPVEVLARGDEVGAPTPTVEDVDFDTMGEQAPVKPNF